MMKKVLSAAFFLFFYVVSFSRSALPAEAAEPETPKGLWVTCIGESNVLGSRQGIEKVVEFAKKTRIKALFVQVYRGDEAWFDSEIADASPFQRNREAVGTDSFRLLIELAHAEQIEVHAWINSLTLSKNREAKLLKEHGKTVLTKDQHKRPAMIPKGKKSLLDRFYMREDQLFLEPGDPRVRTRIAGVVRELAQRYEALDGIHFDYIRYPASPPYLPGSRFNALGLSYGYGEENVKLFMSETSVDPYEVNWKFKESQAWDDWKRNQVTSILREAARGAREIKPDIKISCAVIPSFDRAYFAAYQDWVRWIEENIVDFVVLMNYSRDTHYVRLATKHALGLVEEPRFIRVGLGAFLVPDEPEVLDAQLQQCLTLRPGGLVLFDYDSIKKAAPLRAVLEK